MAICSESYAGVLGKENGTEWILRKVGDITCPERLLVCLWRDLM
jgi:hypothetical protein